MDVKTETLPGLRLATLRHLGPYQQIGRTFGRLHEIVTRAALPHRELVGVYFDTDCRAATPLPANVHGRAGEMLTTSAEVLVASGDDTAELVAIA